MIGLRFGRLMVLSEEAPYLNPGGQTARQFLCLCDCGNKATIRGSTLRTGASSSCGCFVADKNRQRGLEEDPLKMVGRRIGRLTILRMATAQERDSRGPFRWYLCRCKCGNEKITAGYVLRRKTVVSCGCYSIERSTKHGYAKHGARAPEYGIWTGIIKRCENKNSQDFPEYGGRGIVMCKRWRKSFPVFLADMGPRPSRKHSIDRINTNGNYTPSNCRWATPKQQANNQRRRRTKKELLQYKSSKSPIQR